VSDSLLALLVATLGGAAVGVERQWSGHATGPTARFAGVRTFALLGALAGLSGRLWVWGAPLLAAVMLLAAGGLIAIAYVVASRRDVDATTEVAALVVLAAGTAAGLGQTEVASGVVAVTALLLLEKSRLHNWIARVDIRELSAAFRFAVMAVVILPLLPEGPYGPLGGVRPRELWMLVLFFSGLSFGGYLARRVVGASRGYPVAGLLGGMVSSTSVTLSFARLSRDHAGLGMALAQGVVAANTVLYVRVVVAATVLSPTLALALIPHLAAPFAIGAIAAASGLWWREHSEHALELPRNPLQLRSALEMALLFQVVLFVVDVVGRQLGSGGVLATAAVLGLNDADALTLSMAKSVETGLLTTAVAAEAVTVGLLSNTCVKLALAGGVGAGPFRTLTVAVLALMAATLGLGVWL
jgi:uncharacterized membrane protein (DUF4010 family)